MASNYAWSKKDILENVYFDELFLYSKLINIRKINESKIALAIATNPQTKNPKKLWDELDRQERTLNGMDYLDAEFDQAAFDRFKQTLQRNNGNIVIK